MPSISAATAWIVSFRSSIQARIFGVELAVNLGDVESAAERIGDAIVRTPTSRSRTLADITGARSVWLKLENLQFTASFKERGARNFLLSLSDDARARGVVAASAGNHAQGVAYHASLLGIPATIVMPAATPFTKVTNTVCHGARVELEGDAFPESLVVAQDLAHNTGATFVPAFDDPLIIAGQGTVGLEMLADAPGLDVLVVPVGGGGLISGIATAVHGLRPDVEVFGVQVDAYAGMVHALHGGPMPVGGTTIAEGIALLDPGVLTTEIVRALVADVVTVPESRIEEAIGLALEIEKTVLEGAGAAALAALLEHPERFADRAVGVVCSGGNIDLRVLSSVILRALARSGRIVRLHVEVADRPGVLATIAGVVGAAGGNIVDVAHRRDLPGVALKSARLEVSVETRDADHAEAIISALIAAGFHVESA
jgi:threonine dehydratase